MPGVGPTLARRIHDTLGVDTLEALEIAAHDGRLASVPGIGSRRAAMIRAQLAAMLGRARAWSRAAKAEPPAQAHQLHRTDDWVVVYFHTDTRPEGQRTVVTETRGVLAGKRVVRGREGACRAYYAAQNTKEEGTLRRTSHG